MGKPYLIIPDEPCVGLDPGARETFLSSLQTMGMQKGTPSLIYVTHHIEEIMPIFKKILILKGGKMLAWGKKEEIIRADIIENLFLKKTGDSG